MPAISFQSVSKAYPSPRGPKGSTFLALDRVSLEIEEGEFFGLLGPNGAGKTTLISILAGLSRANTGSARVLGHDVQRDYAQARRCLGVVPQELVFDPFFNVREALRIQSGYFGVKNNEAWIDELLDSLGLTDKAGSNMRQLSGGMKRRVLVAQALVHKPPVIVLDEPTAGVDVELRQTLWQFIAKLNKQGHTVLLTTHYLEEAEALCGRIAMLKSGRIVALDHTSELLKAASSNVLRFKVDSELPAALAGKARITGRIVQFPAHDALEIEQYLAAVRQAGLVAHDVEIRKADLEDVFLDVMKKHNAPAAAGGGELRASTDVEGSEARAVTSPVPCDGMESTGAGFTAGPPQGETAPSGGSEARAVASPGPCDGMERTGAGFTAGPPQGETAPSGGSEARAAASVGAIP